jgi:filamentous hemagglutinin family protein
MKNGPGAMNRVYRLVWNERTGACVAVAEKTRGRGKRSSGVVGAAVGAVVAAGMLATGAALAAGAPAPGALPAGGNVVSGQASLNQAGGRLDITQASARAAINWQSFDIGSQAQVHISQPGAQSVLLNRVVGADPSAIFGKLTANGQVLLVNPNGIVFGAGSQVDVGGIVASTLDIADADFAAGRMKFTRNLSGTNGSVLNQGRISAKAGGYVALLAPEVINEGVISAQLGTVALAAGDAVTLQLAGSSLLGVKVDPATIDALVENRQLVQAEGGQVILSAGAAQRLREQAVAANSADSGATALVSEGGTMRLVSAGGRIEAGGGQVGIEGSIVDLSGQVLAGGRASGGAGGQIAVQADYIGQGGLLDVSATAGAGGRITLGSATTIQTASAQLKADGSTAGGSIRLDGLGAGSTLYSSASFSALGAAGSGGDISASANSVQLRAATLDASGSTGGGRIRVGGGFQGRDGDIANAQQVGVNGTSVLRADATAGGNGGQVVVWSDDSTVFGGQVVARGGSAGGNGGQAEVSGKGNLVFQGRADLAARGAGHAGSLLLDPRNLIVDEVGSALASLAMTDPTPSSTDGFGSATKVLGNGNVVVTAPGATTGTTANTGAVYLFDSRTGALLSNLRGSHAGDRVGSAGIQTLANGNFLVLSPSWNPVTGVNVFSLGSSDPGAYGITASSTASAGAITWQGAGGSSSSIVSSANSVVGSTSNTDSRTTYGYSGATVTTGGSVTVTANDRLGNITTYTATGAVASQGTTVLYELSDGNVAIAASNWSNGRGAVVWMNGSTGALSNSAAGGVVDSSNAIVGSSAIVSQALVATDSSGRKVYVTGVDRSLPYTNFTNGINARSAPPGGSGDAVGSSITLLAGGAFAISSPTWRNGATDYAGAVTWVGAGGGSGAVSSSNSLVGSHAYDFVGSGGVTPVAGGANYVVASPYWTSSSNAAAGRYLENAANGAATWVNGGNGQIFGAGATGAVLGSTNSLTGGNGDFLGMRSNGLNTLVQATYNYTNSPCCTDNGTYTSRTYASSNGVQALANGNYLVIDPMSNTSRGSVTFGVGTSGLAGSVSSANSLVGSTSGDRVGSGVTELSGSQYVVASPYWTNGSAFAAGAATLGSGSTGISGAVSPANSLVGSDSYERVGSGGVLAVGGMGSDQLRQNYLVLSPQWGGRSGSATSTVAYGAVTWGSGSTGVTGAVSAANSLVGNAAGDYIGSYHYQDTRSATFYDYNGTAYVANGLTGWDASLAASVDVLDNGNYVVRSASWGGGKGAATFGLGTSGVRGTVSSSNSLVGSIADAYATATTSDGSQTFYNINGTFTSATFTRVTTYSTTTGDHVGLLGQTLSGGRELLISPAWNGGRGAISFVGSSGATGVVSASNSVVGSTADVYSDANHTTLVSPGDRLGTLADTAWNVPWVSSATSGGQTYVTTDSLARRVGPYWFNHTLGSSGETAIRPVNLSYNVASNWYVTGFTLNGYPISKELSNGSVLVASPSWNNGSAVFAGAITWFSATGQLGDGSSAGVLGSGNSLVGSHTRDYLGYRLPVDGVVEMQGSSTGSFVIANPQWWDDRGAVTWGSATQGVTGTVDASNSLVGSRGSTRVATTLVSRVSSNSDGTWFNNWVVRDTSTTNASSATRDGDRIGQGGVFALADGNAVVSSPFWDFNASSYAYSAYAGYGAPKSKGAVTWLNGATGATFGGAVGGSVSATNSLVGSVYGDAVSWAAWEQNLPSLTTTFLMQGVTRLGGGRYAVASPYWSSGSAAAVGAVTFSAAGGMAGAIGAANSLVGSSSNDHVGLSTGIRVGASGTNRQMISGVTAFNAWDPVAQQYVSRYLVRSPDWTNVADVAGGGAKAGAVTWLDGNTGMAYGQSSRAATVSVTNSLIGNVANDAVGSYVTKVKGTVNGQAVTTGDLLVFSNISDASVAGAGAATLISGLTGLSGPISWRNSVIGLAPTANGQSSLAYGGSSNLQNYSSDLQYALLPAAVTAAETVAWRPLLWAAPNSSSGKNSSQVVALTALRDNASISRNADQINGDGGGDQNWNSSLHARDAAGFASVGGSSGLLGFAAGSADDVVLTSGLLTSMLNAGTNVTLQASRDITVVRDIVASAAGHGGNLTLTAGHSILLYGSITTDNGEFTAIANESIANGVVPGSCSTCVALLTMAPGTRIDTGSAHLTLNLLKSTDKASNAAGSIYLSSLYGDFIQASNAGLTATGVGRGIRFSRGAVIGNGGTERIELFVGGTSATGGALVLQSDTQFAGTDVLNLASSDNVLGMTLGAASGGGLAITAAEMGALIKQSSGFGSLQFGSGNQAGATVVNALDFTQAALLRSGSTLASNVEFTGGAGGINIAGNLKSGAADGYSLGFFTFDGAISLGASVSLTATTGNLSVTTYGGSFTQAAGSTLNAARLYLGGDGAATLTAGSNTIGTLGGNFGSASIKTTSSVAIYSGGLSLDSGLVLQASGAGSDITLNGTVSTTGGDLVLAAGRNFINSSQNGLNSGSGRYLVYSTDPAATTEGLTGYAKHYAQTYSAGSTPGYAGSGNWFLYSVAPTITVTAGGSNTITYGSSASTPSASITGFIDGDTLASATTGSLNSSLSGYTPSGAGSIPAGSYTLTLSGQGSLANSLGYAISVTPGTGTLTVQPKAISVGGLSANSKVYDGTTGTTVSGSASLSSGGATSGDGKTLDGDAVAITGSASGSFADRHVANGKSVTLSGLTLTGADALNYTISAGSVTANITPKTLTVSGLSTAASKVYDGGTGATVSGSAALAATESAGSGSTGDGKPYSGDTLSLSGTATGTYNAASVAAASTVTFGGISLGGAQAGDYVLSLPSQAATITPKALTLSGVTAQNKVYDASLAASFSGTAALAGVVGSDAVSLSGTLAGSFANANVGTAKPITTGGLSLAGGAAGNYSLSPYAPTANITARTLTVSALDASKTYGDIDPTLAYTLGGLGLVGSDTASSVFTGALGTTTGAAATAGTHAITQGSLAVGNGNYQLGSYTAGTLTVAKAVLAVTADNKSKTYGDTDPTLSYSVNTEQLKYTDTASVVSGVNLSTTTGAAASAGTHAIAASGGTAANYTLALGNGTLSVAKAALTVTADDKSKTYGDTDPTLSYSVNAGQLKYEDSASVVSGVSLGTTTGASATAGTHAIAASGGTAANYTVTLNSGTLNVAKAALTVTADDRSKTYGDADPTLSYSVNAGQLKYADTASVVSGVSLGTDTGAAATAGTHAITASGGTAANYTLALNNGTLNVAKAVLAVTADNKSKTYGDTDPTLSYSVNTEQLKYTDTASVVSGVNLSTTTGAAATAGTHAISASGGAASNYNLVLAGGTLSVAKATLAVSADDKAKTYGDIDPALSYTVNAGQLKYSDTAAVVSGVTLSTTTGAAATAGTHTIAAGGGTASNYNLVLEGGTLSVAKAALAVSADNKSKTYGDADPTLSYTVNAGQLKYEDTASVVSGVSLGTTTGAAATAGTHAITASGGTAANYTLALSDGTLNVAKATLDVSADNKSKTYGDTDPALSYTVQAGQLKYGDTASVVSGVNLGTTTGAAATAGTHAISASGGAASNYELVLADGTLTVARAALTVAAAGKRKTYGDADPALSYTVNAEQLRYDDAASVVSGVTLATASGAAATAGTHVIAVNGGGADNYVLTLVNGSLTVDRAALTVAADARRKTYGDADPALSWSVNAEQLKYGDTAGVVSGVMLSTSTGAAATAGTHVIDARGGAADNYVLNLVNGTLTVDRAALTVAADARRKTYGDADPALGYTVDARQLKYGDTASVVSGVSLSTATGAAATAGSHVIAAGGGMSDNYTLNLVDATLTVDRAALTVSADARSKTYGDVDPALGWSVNASQLKYSDTASVVSGVRMSTATGAAATAGTHVIAAEGGSADNYTLTLVNGVLSVAKAPLTVSANDQSKTAGERDPSLSYSVNTAQLKYTDTASVVSGVQLTAPSGPGLPPGDYGIVAAAGAADNYALQYIDGKLTVKPSPSVKAENLNSQLSPAAANGGAPAQAPAPTAAGAVPGTPGVLVVRDGGVSGATPGTTAPATAGTAPAGASGSASASNTAARTATPAANDAAPPARLVTVQPQSEVAVDSGREFRFDASTSFERPPQVQVGYSARLADGSPLPAWLKLDPGTGVLSGQAPAGSRATTLDVIVRAEVEGGSAATSRVKLQVGKGG